MSPTLFINVFQISGETVSLEREMITTRAEAVRDAEEHGDEYIYTLTDAGKIDLSSEFSEEFQQKRDFDAAVDRKIDEMKEDRFAEAVA